MNPKLLVIFIMVLFAIAANGARLSTFTSILIIFFSPDSDSLFIEYLSEIKPCISGPGMPKEAQDAYCNEYCQQNSATSGHCMSSSVVGDLCMCDK